MGGKKRKGSNVVGRISWGTAPTCTEIREQVNKETIIFDIHNFVDQEHARGEFLLTKSVEAHGHPWKLGLLKNRMLVQNMSQLV